MPFRGFYNPKEYLFVVPALAGGFNNSPPPQRVYNGQFLLREARIVMSGVARLSFSIEKPLLERLERLVREGRYANRSEFIRDMIRDRLVQREWKQNEEAVGTVTLIYDHHKRGLTGRLTHLQHHHHHVILASTHVHLDETLCAEVIVVKGRSLDIKKLADLLHQEKGVLHAALSVSSTGKELA